MICLNICISIREGLQDNQGQGQTNSRSASMQQPLNIQFSLDREFDLYNLLIWYIINLMNM